MLLAVLYNNESFLWWNKGFNSFFIYFSGKSRSVPLSIQLQFSYQADFYGVTLYFHYQTNIDTKQKRHSCIKFFEKCSEILKVIFYSLVVFRHEMISQY